MIKYTARVAVASFEEAGVTGQIIFQQSSPFSPTTVRVQLNGLSSRADGYHVREFPMDEVIQGSSKCTAAGGHYNPRNIVRNSSSPTTFDAYEIVWWTAWINSNYFDPYLSLFGSKLVQSIVGRSIVIHEPSEAAGYVLKKVMIWRQWRYFQLQLTSALILFREDL